MRMQARVIKALDNDTKKKVFEKRKNDKELMGKRKRETQEMQAAEIMESGNDTIYKCYYDLVHKLVGGKADADIATT